ncbi:sulfite exporter TauE/SafE family protein [Kribbella pittospori]|uniref:Probable membrane transporter protein n=1 Tax=Kribbella pittospori TaxID=722689 RepID=A0A4R0KE98_9ACTN|nr:sulfite exporter TauE/SafE family protein [Kribbella pittospori]TCC57434.1 sulfite exporter TauE/SafE family protein [Kribbella pittospori]
MTGPEHLVVVAAGLGAGLLTSTVGVASLISFPVLIALGIPPVVANASNTVGLLPGALSGSIGYRRELREVPRPHTIAVVLTCAIGAIGGAALLLALPADVFAAAAPWLILFTCLIVGVQPWISTWLRSRHEQPAGERTRMSPATTFFAALTGVYGGYFGAGAGVMMMAVLGLGLDLELRIVNALKTLALLAANLVASVIFVFVADLNLTAAALLAAGSVVGGYVGSHIGRRLPSGLLRALIVLAGIIAAVLMLR